MVVNALYKGFSCLPKLQFSYIFFLQYILHTHSLIISKHLLFSTWLLCWLFQSFLSKHTQERDGVLTFGDAVCYFVHWRYTPNTFLRRRLIFIAPRFSLFHHLVSSTFDSLLHDDCYHHWFFWFVLFFIYTYFKV